MATQVRIYDMKPGKLDSWVRLFETKVVDLRERQGFELVSAWRAPAKESFVWILRYDGTEEEFEEADEAYYELPEHEPLHEEALDYLASGESFFVDHVGP